MCKVMMMSGLKKDKMEKAVPFIQMMGHLMSKSNTDGLGYVAMKEDGSLFGERWLYNDTAWNKTMPVDTAAHRLVMNLPDLTSATDSIPFERNEFGEGELEDAVSILLHTRMATSGRGMHNTHPFVTKDNKFALIHNGVITNDRDFELTLSTCDSEAILVSYMKNKVHNKIENIQSMADELRGYYACGIYSSSRGIPQLDIFRANGANLHVAYINDLETFVFSTSGDDIRDACKYLELTHEPVYAVKEEKVLRLDPITGNRIALESFKSSLRYGASNWNNASYHGAKVYNPPAAQPKQSNLSPGMISYLTKQPSISKMTAREVEEHFALKVMNG